MGNRVDPLEDLQFALRSTRNRALHIFLHDNTLCAREREVIQDFDAQIAAVVDIRTRKQLASLIEKGGDPTPYMNRIAEPIGMKISRIEDARNERKIVPFPTEPEFG